ncbi:MAG: LysE family transporter [Acidobacteria bacterium]|nr:LysE family transporter [Acidobacteriota bacterium]
MKTMVAVAGLLAVGAFSPGPNNLIVLRTCAVSGWSRAVPAMAGVVLGGLALLGLVIAGATRLFHADDRLPLRLAAVACLCLAGFGMLLIIRTIHPSPRFVRGGNTAVGFTGLFTFQFLNPKSWILVIASVASLGAAPDGEAIAQLVGLFTLIPTLSLITWSLAGVAMMRQLERRSYRIWFDRATGAILIAFAISLLLGVGDLLGGPGDPHAGKETTHSIQISNESNRQGGQP